MSFSNGALGSHDKLNLRTRVRVPPHVVYRAFAAETVVLNLESGQYHGLNPTAARMLETLERSESLGDAVSALAEVYGRDRDELASDVLQFCRGLADRDLITVESAP